MAAKNGAFVCSGVPEKFGSLLVCFVIFLSILRSIAVESNCISFEDWVALSREEFPISDVLLVKVHW